MTGVDMLWTFYLACSSQRPCTGAAGAGQSVLEWLLSEAPDLALIAVATAVAALWWPDSDSGAKATAFCRSAFATPTAQPCKQIQLAHVWGTHAMNAPCMYIVWLMAVVDCFVALVNYHRRYVVVACKHC